MARMLLIPALRLDHPLERIYNEYFIEAFYKVGRRMFIVLQSAYPAGIHAQKFGHLHLCELAVQA